MKSTAKKLRLSCSATIGHINARKEGPDDDKVLACDLKLAAIVDALEVMPYFDDALLGALFMEQGQVRNMMIGAIPFAHELTDYRMTIGGLEQRGVKVKKFAVSAMDGWKLSLSFSVSFQPAGDEVAILAESLQDDIAVELEPSNAELDFSDPAPAEYA